MAIIYVDINCADDTGTAESPYFTALLGASTSGYKELQTALAATALTAEDTVHVAPGEYTATATIGGTNFRRYIVVYGDVSLDGSAAGDVHAIQCRFAGWMYFTAGTSGAKFIIKNYTSAVLKQMLYGTPGRFDFRGVACVLSNSTGEGVRIFDSSASAYPNPANHFDTLILHNIARGFRVDGTNNGHTTTVNQLCSYGVDRVVYTVSGDTAININQSLIGMTVGYQVYTEAAFAGSITINNSILAGGSAPHNNVSPLTDNVVAGSVTINNSFVFPSPRFANTTSGTTNNSVTDDEPALKTSFMEGSVSFNIDDSKNADAFTALMTEADARGIKVGWAVDWHNRDMTEARWATAREALTNGHDIYIHTKHSANMGDQFAFRIRYVGAGSACSMDIADGILSTSVTGASDDLNITLSDYDSVIDLVTYINGLAGYSAETFDQDSVRVGATLGAAAVKYAGEPSTDMFGTQAEANISTATDIEYDQSLFFSAQITENKQAIYENTGYMPTSMIYPGGQRSSALDETIEGYGVLIARDTLPDTGNEKYYPDNIAPLGMSAWPVEYIAPTADSEAARRRKLIGFFEWVKVSGAKINLWQHDLIAYSQAQWAVVLSAAVESGVTVKTLTEQATDMRKGARSVVSGEVIYSQDTLSSFINYCYDVEYMDDYAGRDTGLRYWGTSPNPVGIDGEPFSDIDTTIGLKQSKDGPFHPRNL